MGMDCFSVSVWSSRRVCDLLRTYAQGGLWVCLLRLVGLCLVHLFKADEWMLGNGDIFAEYQGFFAGRLTAQAAALRAVQDPKWNQWNNEPANVPVIKMTLSVVGAAVLSLSGLLKEYTGNRDGQRGWTYRGGLRPFCPHGYFAAVLLE